MNNLDQLIIAHRGESFNAPENTLASINLAWKRGDKAVEIDIQLTRDGEIVVIHDTNTFRTAGKKLQVAKSTLSELKTLDAGSFKGKEWIGESIPTLQEVIDSVPKDCRLIIEIKCNSAILKALQVILKNCNLRDNQIELIAFNASTLANAKAMMPQYKAFWLLDLDYTWPWWIVWKRPQKIIRKAKKLKFDGVDVWGGKLLTQQFILEMHHAGLLVYTWTVDSYEMAKSLIGFGIDGITTNRAKWLKEQLKHR